ncbi:MAG: amino acid ABC transporter substrate-binding protein [Acidilobaceae archaeon]
MAYRTSLVIGGIVVVLLILLGLVYFFTAPSPAVPTPTTPTPTPTTPLYTPITTPSPTPTPTPEIRVPDKIVIGLTISLSGTYAKEGQMGLLGLQTAVKWVNEVYGGVRIGGKRVPIEIKYYDDESKRDLVVSLYERLITVDKVNFILGPYSSPLAFAAAPVAEKYKMVFINWGGASDLINQQGYKYALTVWSQASRYHATSLEFIAKVDPTVKRIAILYADDEFNRVVAEGARKRARELGFTIVFDRSFPRDIKDFTPILVELKTAYPDAIVAGTHFANGLLLSKQLADLRINVKFLSLTVAPAVPEYYESLGILAEGVVFPSHWEPGVKYNPEVASKIGLEFFGPTSDEFYIMFLAVSKGQQPSYHAASAAAALILLVKAIELAQSLDQDAVREAFNNMDIMTFFGRFKIDPTTGYQLGHSMVLGQWQDGVRVIIWPPESATGKYYYPIPTWEEKLAGKKAKP